MINGDLLIRCRKDEHTYELIPHDKLIGDFPRHMVEQCAHWICLETKEVEFRPINKQWEEDDDNPRLYYGIFEMRNKNRKYLDIHSSSAEMIHAVLHPLEWPDSIQISISVDSSSLGLEIILPRLNLNIFLNENEELEFKQFRGMVVDQNQSVDILIGLKNRLVLRHKNVENSCVRRKVVIPYGEVTYGIIGYHVKVEIDTGLRGKVAYFTYDVDRTLCQLTSDTTLLSRLYKIYLNALTSHCLPDTLTLRTGTEEALYDLYSAATWSFKDLKQEERNMFERIAKITPARTYYPEHLKCMKMEAWNELPSLSQHEGFCIAVEEILEHSSRFEIFRKSCEPTSSDISTKLELVERAAARNSKFRVEEFGGSYVDLGVDKVYDSRDLICLRSSPEATICAVARNTDAWSTSLNVSKNILKQYEVWGPLSSCIDGARAIQLGHNMGWLDENINLKTMWCSLYDACTRATKKNRYGLMFVLSELAYANNKVELPLIWTLLAFATVPEFAKSPMPNYISYDLSYGYDANRDTIKKTIKESAIEFENSNESCVNAISNECEEDRKGRGLSLYKKNLKDQTANLETNFYRQWVCSQPIFPASSSSPLIIFDKMESRIKNLFGHWFKNRQLRLHTLEIQEYLDACHTPAEPLSGYAFPHSSFLHVPGEDKSARVSLAELFIPLKPQNYPVRTEVICIPPPKPLRVHDDENSSDSIGAPLKKLLARLEIEGDTTYFKGLYVKDLRYSLQELQKLAKDESCQEAYDAFHYKNNLHLCKEELNKTFNFIKENLEKPQLSSSTRRFLQLAGLWPRISPKSLLGLLSRPVRDHMQREKLVEYGLAIARFQRAERMYALSLVNNKKELMKEVQNPGHRDWDPMEHPEWLLLEIESGILIRPIQAKIAYRMMAPDPGVVQLNMGEGKSSGK
jgi:hypothetical protein